MDLLTELVTKLNIPEKYLIVILMLTGYALITLFQVLAKKYLKTNPVLTAKIIFVVAGVSLLFYLDYFKSWGIEPLYVILASACLIVAGTYTILFKTTKTVLGGIRHG